MTSNLSLQPDGKYYISWMDLHKDVVTLAKKLPSHPWEGLVAITRGGLAPAAIIARILNITLIETVCLSSYDDKTDQQTDLTILKDISERSGKNWLIIDDLIDTGATIHKIREMLPEAHCAAIYGKAHGKHLIDTFGREINAWIVFPWEISPEELEKRGLS